MKHVAFTLCLEGKIPQCRAAFMKIYEVDANFNLTPAEAGHPSWTKTFASAKAQAKKAARQGEGSPGKGQGGARGSVRAEEKLTSR